MAKYVVRNSQIEIQVVVEADSFSVEGTIAQFWKEPGPNQDLKELMAVFEMNQWPAIFREDCVKA